MVKSLVYGANLSDHHPLYADIVLAHDALAHTPTNAITINLGNSFQKSNGTPEQLSCYNVLVANNLPYLSPNVISCTDPTCVAHLPKIDSFLISLQQCLIHASQNSFTYLNSSTAGRKQNPIPGWNDAARSLKSQANFWYKV